MNKQSIRENNLAAKYQTPGQLNTVMIRNVPPEYKQDDLLVEVGECLGRCDLFDFFYLPWDMANNANVGYAFVNLKDTATALRAIQVLTNYRFKLHEGRRVARVVPAHIQGLENNLRHLQDRAIVHGNHPCTPVVMWNRSKIELSKVFDEFRAQMAVREQLSRNHQGFQMPVPFESPASVRDTYGHGKGSREDMSAHIADFCEMMDRAAGFAQRENEYTDNEDEVEDIPRPMFGSAVALPYSDSSPILSADKLHSFPPNGLPTMFSEAFSGDPMANSVGIRNGINHSVGVAADLHNRHVFAHIREDHVVEIALEPIGDDCLLRFLRQFRD